MIFENRLAREKSPYLLQHKNNPVDWYPWCEKAFEKAKEENKPIFLSIGYSTCHWCHVMERESFESKEVAEILNKDFVSIKVDREERPDIDSVYMSVCQALTGSGGWPLTIIMDSDKKPFYAGTYLPKNSGYGIIGLLELLPEVIRIWKTSKDELHRSIEKIMEHMNDIEYESSEGEPKKELLHRAFEAYKQSYDKQFGGFGSQPKFPTPHNLMFLMRYAELEKEEYAMKMAVNTLDSMFCGGIFDHIGGGFSRYSTDRIWLVPHFEKMLYDNALLLIAYSMGYNITKSEHYSFVIKQVVNYLMRELKSAEGGFFCGQDADSEGEEGKYYVFTKNEIMQVLKDDFGERFCDWFGIKEVGNFEGRSIPNLIANKNFRQIPKDLEVSKSKLLEYRRERTSLHKDDKCLTAWNSLAICGLLSAYMVLGDKSYLKTAIETQSFIEEKLTDGGRLFVRYREGEKAGYGKLEDYAFYSWALIELYQCTFDAEYLRKALKYSQIMCDEFFDSKEGGFYLYSKFDEQLIIRPKDSYDSAMPSGNSVAAFVLEKLSKLTGEKVWQERAIIQNKFINARAEEYPMGLGFGLFALTSVLYPSEEIIAVLPEWDDLEKLKKRRLENPNINILVKTHENQKSLDEIAPFTKNYHVKNKAELYICTNNSCKPPV